MNQHSESWCFFDLIIDTCVPFHGTHVYRNSWSVMTRGRLYRIRKCELLNFHSDIYQGVKCQSLYMLSSLPSVEIDLSFHPISSRASEMNSISATWRISFRKCRERIRFAFWFDNIMGKTWMRIDIKEFNV